jgi:hypothetical protein
MIEVLAFTGDSSGDQDEDVGKKDPGTLLFRKKLGQRVVHLAEKWR